MADQIDSLEVQVKAQAQQANAQLDKLVAKLNQVSGALNNTNTSGLSGLANGVKRFAEAASLLSNVRTSDFTRLTKNIQSLSSMNTAQMYNASSAITMLTKSLNTIGAVSQNALQVSEVAKSISKLGGVNVQRAITNMPLLATAINNLMTTLSKSPTVSSNVIQLTNSIANLASQGSKVGTASKSITNGLNATSTASIKASHSFKSLAYYIGKLYANYFILIRAFKSLGTAITSSMDYIEEYNYFNVTMGKIGSEWEDNYSQYGYDSAEAYANSFENRMNELTSKMTGFNVQSDGTLIDSGMTSLGLNVTSLMNYEAGLGQITNSLGLTGEASLATSKALSMLAGDMSSFRNTELSTVMTNFQSGLIGQSRALYKYGIDITNATLQTYAYDLGISKAVQEMTQGEKMQLRTIAILDQSKVAWGDLANTLESPANQLRMLKNNMSALSRTIGNLFLPMVAKVLPYVNGLAIAVRRLFEYTADMLGIDLSGIISNSGAGYSDALEGLEDDADGLTDGLDDATASAKALKNQVMGFDEANILQDNTSTTSSGNTSGDEIDLTDQINNALSDYEKVWNSAYENMTNSANGFADKIYSILKNLADLAKDGDYQGVGEYIASGINNSIINTDWTTIGENIGSKLMIIPNIAYGFVSKLKWTNLGKSFGNGINGAISKINLGVIGGTIGKTITGIFDMFSSTIKTVDWKKAGANIANGINKCLINIKGSSIAKGINSIIDAGFDLTLTLITKIKWSQIPKTIGNVLKNLDWGDIVKLGLTVGALKLTKSILSIGVDLGGQFISGLTTCLKSGLGSKLSSTVGSALSSASTSVCSAGGTLGSKLATAITSPVGLATIGITAALAIAMTEINKYYDEQFEYAYEASDKAKDVVETTTSLADAANKAREAIDNQTNSEVAQLDNTTRLWNELQTLCDTNGIVKDSDKDRAEFILGELNNALDTEYTMTGNQIQNYKNLNTEITDLIKNKRLNAYMTGAEKKYSEAIENSASAEADRIKNLEALNAQQDVVNKAYEEYQKLEQQAYNNPFLTFKRDKAHEAYTEAQNEYNSIKKSYEVADTTYKNYMSDISAYESASIKAQQGYTDEAIDLLEQYNTSVAYSSTFQSNASSDNVDALRNEVENKGILLIQAQNDLQNCSDAEKSIYQERYNTAVENFNDTLSKYTAMGGNVYDVSDTIASKTSKLYSDTDKTIREHIQSWENSASSSGSSIGSKIISGISSSVRNGMSTIQTALNDVIKSVKINTPTTTVKVDTTTDGARHITFGTRATGGFVTPEDGWFRANHGEIMGQFDDGQSVVANNNQITDGIANATYRGNQETNTLLRQLINAVNNSSGETEIVIDGQTVFNVVKKRADNYTMQTGRAPFLT